MLDLVRHERAGLLTLGPDWGIMNAAGLFAAVIPLALAFLLCGLVVRGPLAGMMKG
jgi:ABC-type glycerol-3-phosphate transport system permease component